MFKLSRKQKKTGSENNTVYRKFYSGDEIIRENDTGETAYIIEKGRVEVSMQKDGQKIHLAFLESEETFGEMGMIDDRLRSATVTAVEETTVLEIPRDSFFKTVESDPDIAIHLLRTLFERLREANETILQLKESGDGSDLPFITTGGDLSTSSDKIVTLEGLTEEAIESLPENPYTISSFPCRIGRKSRDPLAHNDLMLINSSRILQISRHHVKLIKNNDQIGVLDRGSSLGARVDNKRIGGRPDHPVMINIEGSESIIVLGNDNSAFEYKVSIKSV